MIYLCSDYMVRAGGIETYLHALATRLKQHGVPFRVAVTELEPTDLIEELVRDGVGVYRQSRLPGDTWCVRQRCMILWLASHLRKNDWVYCVRQPNAQVFLFLARIVHWRGAKLAVSWAVPPSVVAPPPGLRRHVASAVRRTDVVISTNRSTLGEFASVYDYHDRVHVVPYHSLPLFPAPLEMPSGPPWRVGYLGRFDNKQKNLVCILEAVHSLRQSGELIELHLYGGGGDEALLRAKAKELEPHQPAAIHFHGPYSRRNDLLGIMGHCHFFIYTSHYEGMPLALLEMLQAGRYCITSRVGGIPDLYEGHPEAGTMIEPGQLNDRIVTERALRDTIRLAAEGRLHPNTIRECYDGRFDIESVHAAWLAALGMNGLSSLRTLRG